MAGQGEAFDASVGLAFSLKAFETYRKSGMLSAEVRSILGVRGKGTAYLELMQGKVTACYIIDKAGERHAVNLQTLTQLDTEKGPFSWVFQTDPTPAIPSSFTPPAPRSTKQSGSLSPVPQLQIHALYPQQLQQWTPQQQQYIQLIFSLINGQRSIDEIKAQTLLHSATVDEVIRILLVLRAIAL